MVLLFFQMTLCVKLEQLLNDTHRLDLAVTDDSGQRHCTEQLQEQRGSRQEGLRVLSAILFCSAETSGRGLVSRQLQNRNATPECMVFNGLYVWIMCPQENAKITLINLIILRPHRLNHLAAGRLVLAANRREVGGQRLHREKTNA